MVLDCLRIVLDYLDCFRLFQIVLDCIRFLDCFRLKLMEIDIGIGGLEFGSGVTRFPGLV